jgi:hypothetical protein
MFTRPAALRRCFSPQRSTSPVLHPHQSNFQPTQPWRRHLSKFLFAVLLLSPLLGQIARAQAVLDIGQTDIDGVPTGVGYVDVVAVPSFSATVGYLNVAANVDNQGPTPFRWLVQNLAIPMDTVPGDFGEYSPSLFSATFDLTTSPSGNFNVYASFTADPIVFLNVASMTLNAGITFSTYDIEDLIDGLQNGLDSGEASASAEAPSGRPLLFDEPLHSLVWLWWPIGELWASPAGTGNVRNDTPGIKQGKNECAPTAVAQSLLWLQKRGKIKLPKGVTQGGLIHGLKRAMNPQWEDGTTYPGVESSMIQTGKNAVIHALMLPLTVESGGTMGGDGTFDFVKKQMDKGQDVELRLRGGDIGGPGHLVTVAGYQDDGKKQTIFLKDPLTGGTTVDSYELDGLTVKKYKYAKAGMALLSFAIAESPKQ